MESCHYYIVKVELTNGRSYLRRYCLANTDMELIAPLVESQDYQATNYKFSTGKLGYPISMNINLWDYLNVDVSAENIKRIMDAYYQDFEEHYSMDELASYMVVASLDNYYLYADDSSRHHRLYVPDNYTRTIAVLTELYPNYMPAVQSAEDIRQLSLTAELSEDSVEALYGYFGYEGYVTNRFIDSSEITYVEYPYEGEIYIEQASAVSYNLVELRLTDTELIKQLYPYLYFGYYRDYFDQKNYIYIGDVTTCTNLSLGTYVKTGTLPKELIEQLYECVETIY